MSYEPENRLMRYSEMSSYQRCPRQWFLSWYRGKSSKSYRTNSNLLQGSAVHAGLKAYNEGTDIEEAIVKYTEEQVRDLPASDPGYPEHFGALFDAATAAVTYLEAWPEWAEGEGMHDVGKEVLHVEKQVQVPLAEVAVTLVGRVDRAVRDDKYNGRPVVEDYKTVADFRIRPIQAESQLLTYGMALSYELGEPVAAGRHIRIKKNKRTAQAKPPFFETVDLVYTEEQLIRHMRHTVVWVTKLEESRTMLDSAGSTEGEDYIADFAAPPSPGFHCTSPACPMLDVCSAMDDGSDWHGILDEHFVDRVIEVIE